MISKAFGWEAPAFVLFGPPIFALSSGFFSHWLSLNGCVVIPLCHCHSFFGVLVLCFLNCSGIWRLDFLPATGSVQSVVLRAFFFVTSLTLIFARPTDTIQSFLHRTSFHDKLSHHSTAAERDSDVVKKCGMEVRAQCVLDGKTPRRNLQEKETKQAEEATKAATESEFASYPRE